MSNLTLNFSKRINEAEQEYTNLEQMNKTANNKIKIPKQLKFSFHKKKTDRSLKTYCFHNSAWVNSSSLSIRKLESSIDSLKISQKPQETGSCTHYSKPVTINHTGDKYVGSLFSINNFNQFKFTPQCNDKLPNTQTHNKEKNIKATLSDSENLYNGLFRRTFYRENRELQNKINDRRESFNIFNTLDNPAKSKINEVSNINFNKTSNSFYSEDPCKARTPGHCKNKSQIISLNCSQSPKSILRKPQTAENGIRKQVQINKTITRYNFEKVREESPETPEIKEYLDSSYFRVTKSPPPKLEMKSINKIGTSIYDRISNRIIPKNYKEHMTIRGNIKRKLIDVLKFSKERINGCISKGSQQLNAHKTIKSHPDSTQQSKIEAVNDNYSTLKSIDTQNNFLASTKPSGRQNSVCKFEDLISQNSRINSNFDSITFKPHSEVVQYPFQGVYNPIDVISDPTLMRNRTRQKYSIRLSLTRQSEESSFKTESSQLSNLRQKYTSNALYHPNINTAVPDRSQLQTVNSQIIDTAGIFNPCLIRNKPQAAFIESQYGPYSLVGLKLKNKYSTAFDHKNASTNRDKDCPINKNVKFSSYFKSCKSVPIIKILQIKSNGTKESIYNSRARAINLQIATIT